MAKCPFVDRDCLGNCIAYDNSKPEKCLILHRADRTNMILNFIEKKIDALNNKNF